MGQEQFARMLENIVNDADSASAVAGGDFSSVDDGALTEAEQALLTAAATDLDGDVTGFADGFLKLGDIDGSWKVEEGEGFKTSFTKLGGLGKAAAYLKMDWID